MGRDCSCEQQLRACMVKMSAMSGTCPIQMMKMKPPIKTTVLYVRTRNFRKLSACAPCDAQRLCAADHAPLYPALQGKQTVVS